jgi:uncharacterized delta-60 repeat protein
VSSTAFVERLLPNGALDPRFGTDGRVVLAGVQGFAPSDVPFDERPPPPVRLKVLLTVDGRILVLGSKLVRLNADGSLDTNFGSSGAAPLPAGFSPGGMALAPGGGIVIAGDSTLSTQPSGAVVRLTANGLPDPSFGLAGTGMSVLPSIDDLKGRPLSTVNYRGVAVASDGEIVVAGLGGIAAGEVIWPRDGLLARLTATGALNSTFGKGGQLLVERFGGIPPFDSFDPNTLLLTSDGRALVGAAGCAKFGRCFPQLLVFPATGSGASPPVEGLGCSPAYCEQRLALTPLPGGGVLGGAWEGDLVLERFNSHLEAMSGFGSSEEGEDIFFGGGALATLPAESEMVGNMLVLGDGGVVVAGTSDAGVVVVRLFGLRPPPHVRVSVLARRVRPVAGVVSVPVACAPFVTCRGLGTLQFRSRSSHGNRWTLGGSGPFDIAGGGKEPIVMPLTPAGSAILRRGRWAVMRLTLSLRGTRSVKADVRVAPGAPLPPARNGSPGALAPLSGDVSEFESDGQRYVAFEQGTAVYVLDTRTGRRYAARLPEQCVSFKSDAETLRGMSFPMLLLWCRQSSVLIDADSGRSRRLPNLVSGIAERWAGIGRFWAGPARAPSCPNFYTCQEYLDLTTGAMRRIDTPPTVAGSFTDEVVARSLDSPQLEAVSPCPPAEPSNLASSLVAYPRLYDPPYVLYGQAVDPVNGNPMNSAPSAPAGLVLGRCGDATATVLDAAAAHLNPAFKTPGDQLGAGIASWYNPPSAAVHLYTIAQERRISWTAPGAHAGFREPAAIAHTAYAVIVATASHQFCLEAECTTDSWTLYQARLH